MDTADCARRYNSTVSSASWRAAERAAWPAWLYRLGKEPGDHRSAVTTPEERLAMMWPLSLKTYTRSETPVSLRSLHDHD